MLLCCSTVVAILLCKNRNRAGLTEVSPSSSPYYRTTFENQGQGLAWPESHDP